MAHFILRPLVTTSKDNSIKLSRDMRFPTLKSDAYPQSDQSHCWWHEYYMTLELLNERRLDFLSLMRGCKGSPESTILKIPQCWKSHVVAYITLVIVCRDFNYIKRRRYMAYYTTSPFSVADKSVAEVFLRFPFSAQLPSDKGREF